MSEIALTGAAAVTPFQLLDEVTMLISEGRIEAVGPSGQTEIPPGYRQVPLDGLIIAPGYIDQHLHGCGGASTMDATAESLLEMARFQATHGVTAFLATTFSANMAELTEIAEAWQSLNASSYRAAQCLGLHLEGPMLAREYAGAYPLERLGTLSLADIALLQRQSGGAVKLLTCAPELVNASELAAGLEALRIVPAMGHSGADYNTAKASFEAGFKCVTHCFNALRPYHQREPGILGAALLEPELMIELIADASHLHPATLELAWRLKGAEGIILASDAMAPLGMPDGVHSGPEGDFSIKKGIVTNQDGKLSGTSLTLDKAVRNFMEASGCELTEAVRLASYNPARLLGINKHKGSLYPGKDADLVILTPELEVIMTMIGGEVISGLITLD